jgi:hypothetical protein
MITSIRSADLQRPLEAPTSGAPDKGCQRTDTKATSEAVYLTVAQRLTIVS